MKIYLKDLANIADEKVYEADVEEITVLNNPFINRIVGTTGDIVFYYDNDNRLLIDYELKGTMICPCAVTLEDVEVPFVLNNIDEVVYKEDDEGFYLYKDMTIEEMISYIVVPEAPIKVVKNEKIEYSRGDSWSFVSEEEYADSQKGKIDPRWEKLKDYQFDKED